MFSMLRVIRPLQRLVTEARAVGANVVVGINTSILPFQGVHEMMMLGTASRHPDLPQEYTKAPVTSDLTCEEMWNRTNLGVKDKETWINLEERRAVGGEADESVQ
jgi:hypothetical protein